MAYFFAFAAGPGMAAAVSMTTGLSVASLTRLLPFFVFLPIADAKSSSNCRLSQ